MAGTESRSRRLAIPALIAISVPVLALFVWAAIRQEANSAPVGDGVFTDLTDEARVTTTHHVERVVDGASSGRVRMLISGQAWGDYDNDGWTDLYLTDQRGPNTLLRNDGDGTFSPSPVGADVALAGALSGGAVFADYDNDGWRDLYVATESGGRLFRNDAGDGFTDVTRAAGVAASVPATSGSWGDYDGDGFLDLFVATYECIVCDSPGRDAGGPQHLFRNEGDGTFRDVTALLRPGGVSLYSFIGGWLDYDNDSDLDLYVTSDVRGTVHLEPNLLFRNDGAGCDGWCFTDVTEASGAGVRADAMGLAVGDHDVDGDLDLYFSNTGWDFTPLTGPSVLLLNQGDGTFREDPGSGSHVDVFSWGTLFFDYDNDGAQDIYLAVGRGDKAVQYFPGSDLHDRLLHGDGEGGFDDASRGSGTFDEHPSIGVSTADYNRDGWPDLVVNNFDLDYRILANAGPGRGARSRLLVDLAGDAGSEGGRVNRDAVGARVRLTDSSGRTQLREVMVGSSIGAGNETTLHFGLGATTVESMEVLWPDGTTRVLSDVPADSHVRLAYGGEPTFEPLAANTVPRVTAATPLSDQVDGFGLVIPLLTALTTLAFALHLATRRFGASTTAAWTLKLLVVWAVSFQVAHLLEHFIQMGYWLVHPRRPLFITPWGRVATDGFTSLAGGQGGRATGTELLHLTGNWIFLSGLLAGWLAVRARRMTGRGVRALKVAFFFQLVHVLEHITLTVTWVVFDRPIGVSTLFGQSFELGGIWAATIRGWWHFTMNFVPTVASVFAVVYVDFRRAAATGRTGRPRPWGWAVADVAAWTAVVAGLTVSHAGIRSYPVQWGDLVAFTAGSAVLLTVLLVGGGLYRTTDATLASVARTLGIAVLIAAALSLAADVPLRLVPRGVPVAAVGIVPVLVLARWAWGRLQGTGPPEPEVERTDEADPEPEHVPQLVSGD